MGRSADPTHPAVGITGWQTYNEESLLVLITCCIHVIRTNKEKHLICTTCKSQLISAQTQMTFGLLYNEGQTTAKQGLCH